MFQGRHLLAAAVVFALAAGSCKKSGPKPPEGDIAASLALPLLGGGTYDPAQLAGKRVLLNFWRPG